MPTITSEVTHWVAKCRDVEVRMAGPVCRLVDRFSRGGKTIEEKFRKWGSQLVLKDVVIVKLAWTNRYSVKITEEEEQPKQEEARSLGS
jgi:hypothetical protein